MKIPAKLSAFLNKNKVGYEPVEHRTVYTALDKAATLRVKPGLIVKTLILKAGKEIIMVVLAGNRNLNKVKFKKAAKLKNFDFISEKLMKTKFKDFKAGAVPPFGLLFKIPCFVDKNLLKEKIVYASAGNYETSLKISPKILEKLGAIKANFSDAKKIAKPGSRNSKK